MVKENKGEIYLGIDQSKRSTGCVWVNEKGTLVGFMLICPPASLDGVDLMVYQWEMLRAKLLELDNTSKACIEGLAFGAVGSGKDMLAGLNWMVRVNLKVLFNTYCGTVPVSMWRSKVITKDEQREAKRAGKDGLKAAVFNKMPAGVRKAFADYVEENKDMINKAKMKDWKPGSKSQVYVSGLWDLADAYFISQHCRIANQ